MQNGHNHTNPQQDLEKFIRELIKPVKDFFNNQDTKNSLSPIVSALGVILGGWIIFGSFYTVQPDEEAIVLRLGRYVETRGPGLHFKIPLKVDQVIKLQTKQILQEEFGFRTVGVGGAGGSDYQKKSFITESSMLTGDLNIADVEWVVQYQISDPYKFLFATSNPKKNIRDVSEAIIRRVVGDRLVNSVFERTGMSTESKILIQAVLDKYDMGVRVVSIEFQDVLPPETVRPAFNEVNAARQEFEKLINQAEANYNKVIPEARGRAEKTIAQAEGQAQAISNIARGDADKYNAMLSEYRRSPRITRDRLYLESMEKIFSQAEKLTIVDSSLKGLIPIFSQANSASPTAVPLPKE
jgi:membrane protease subunit HflK